MPKIAVVYVCLDDYGTSHGGSRRILRRIMGMDASMIELKHCEIATYNAENQQMRYRKSIDNKPEL